VLLVPGVPLDEGERSPWAVGHCLAGEIDEQRRSMWSAIAGRPMAQGPHWPALSPAG